MGNSIESKPKKDELIQKQPIAFDLDRVLEQLEDYGKYKGILRCEKDKCENYIPVSVAKKIVRGRGSGEVLGYIEEEVKQEKLVQYDLDEKNEILYIGFRDKSNSYGEDLGDIIIMRDINTNEVTGVTIMNYSRETK